MHVLQMKFAGYLDVFSGAQLARNALSIFLYDEVLPLSWLVWQPKSWVVR